jgi:hypothetical protein
MRDGVALSICDAIGRKILTACNHGVSARPPGKAGAESSAESNSRVASCPCLHPTVHMKDFPDIVLPTSADRRRELLARERRFSDTFATCH